MKKNILTFAALAAVVSLTGCAQPNSFGTIYGDTTLAHTATGNSLKGSKRGEATVHNILGISVGAVGIKEAADSAGITKISAVDVHGTVFLGIYANTTTIVYGE